VAHHLRGPVDEVRSAGYRFQGACGSWISVCQARVVTERQDESVHEVILGGLSNRVRTYAVEIATVFHSARLYDRSSITDA
jgi:hypothetical protein